MPLGPVSLSLGGLPITQAPRQPDPAPPPQASGAADAPAWSKPPDPDQPAPQRAQPGQGPQDQQPEAQGRRQDAPALAAELTAQEQALVRQLKQTDAQVRAHEQAHVAAGGSAVTGGAAYTYQVGPDNKRYAVGGEVSIDLSEEPGDPRATMQKAQTVRRAALAPADPSPQDLAVASQAASMEAQARAEAAALRLEESRASQESGGGATQDEQTAPGPRTAAYSRPPEPPPISVRLNPLSRWA